MRIGCYLSVQFLLGILVTARNSMSMNLRVLHILIGLVSLFSFSWPWTKVTPTYVKNRVSDSRDRSVNITYSTCPFHSRRWEERNKPQTAKEENANDKRKRNSSCSTRFVFSFWFKINARSSGNIGFPVDSLLFNFDLNPRLTICLPVRSEFSHLLIKGIQLLNVYFDFSVKALN